MSEVMATKILTMNIDDASAERIRAVSDQVELIVAGSEEKFEEELPQADILIGEIQPKYFPKAKRVRWMAYYSAGIDFLMSPEIEGPSDNPNALALGPAPVVSFIR